MRVLLIVFALAAAAGATYFFVPPVGVFVDRQIAHPGESEGQRYERVDKALQSLTVRAWLGECDRSMSGGGACFETFAQYRTFWASSYKQETGKTCDAPGGWSYDARTDIKKIAIWFRTHRGYYGYALADGLRSALAAVASCSTGTVAPTNFGPTNAIAPPPHPETRDRAPDIPNLLDDAARRHAD